MEFDFAEHYEKGPEEDLKSSAERELWPILVATKRWGNCGKIGIFILSLTMWRLR